MKINKTSCNLRLQVADISFNDLDTPELKMQTPDVFVNLPNNREVKSLDELIDLLDLPAEFTTTASPNRTHHGSPFDPRHEWPI